MNQILGAEMGDTIVSSIKVLSKLVKISIHMT